METKWQVILIVMVLILGSGATLIINSDSFELKFDDYKIKYKEGVLKTYEGRYLLFSDEIIPLAPALFTMLLKL